MLIIVYTNIPKLTLPNDNILYQSAIRQRSQQTVTLESEVDCRAPKVDRLYGRNVVVMAAVVVVKFVLVEWTRLRCSRNLRKNVFCIFIVEQHCHEKPSGAVRNLAFCTVVLLVELLDKRESCAKEFSYTGSNSRPPRRQRMLS